MYSPKKSLLSAALLGIFLFYTCAFGSVVPFRRDLQSFDIKPLPASQGFSKRDHSILSKRAPNPPVPSVEDCKSKLSVDRDKAVFYSGGLIETAQAYASSIGGKTVWEAGLKATFDAIQVEIQKAINAGQESWGEEEYFELFVNHSKAFAMLAAGTVIAVLPEGSDGNVYFPADGLFLEYELPILKDPMQNGDVEVLLGLAIKADKTNNGALKQIYPCPS